MLFAIIRYFTSRGLCSANE